MPRLYRALVIDRPWVTLVLLALLGAAAAWAARDFHLDASSDSLVVETDPDLAYFRNVNRRFGSSEFLVVTYAPPGDLLGDASLAEIRSLRDELAAIDGVSSVLSILDVPLLRSPPSPLSELADNVRTLESVDVDLALAHEELTSSPLYRNLIVSADGRSTAIQVNFPVDARYAELVTRRNDLLQQRLDGELDPAEAGELATVAAEFDAYKRIVADRQHRLVAAVREVVADYQDGATLHVGGVPMIADDMLTFVRNDLQTFGLGVLALIVLTLGFFFRRPRWVALPLACSALVTLYMVGLLGAADWPITVISSNFVSLLIIISISLSIHLIVRYRELLAEDPERDQRDLVMATVMDKFWPCFYTAVTTMVAFGSLVSSGILPVIDFGWMMTIGVAVALCVAFTLFPSVLMLLPKGQPGGTLGRNVDATEWLGRITARGLWPTVAVCALLALAAGLGISRLSVENSFIDYFDESTEIYRGMTFIDEHLGGTTPLDVLIEFPKAPPISAGADDAFGDPFADSFAEDPTGETFQDPSLRPAPDPEAEDPFADPFADPFDDPFADPSGDETAEVAGLDRYWFTPDKVLLLERIQDWLDAQPETGKAISLATLHDIAMQFNDDERLDAAQLAFVIGAVPPEFQRQLLKPYVDTDASQARISVRIIESNRDMRRGEFLDRVRTGISAEFGLDPERVRLTGMMVLFNNMLETLFSSQVTTILWVGAGILLTFVVLFRSPVLGVLALLPNALAAAMVLGIMGYAGLPLDMMTITIAAIVIGIGVDDTIHYVHRFQQELPRSDSYLAALHASHGSIGHAMYYTSLTVIAGFSILVLSNFNPTIYFGCLTALSMALALLANLTLLPALMVLARPFGPPGSALPQAA